MKKNKVHLKFPWTFSGPMLVIGSLEQFDLDEAEFIFPPVPSPNEEMAYDLVLVIYSSVSTKYSFSFGTRNVRITTIVSLALIMC